MATEALTKSNLPEYIDPQIHTLVVAAIKENILARTLNEEQVNQVAIQAIQENKMNDQIWLQQAIRKAEEESPHIPGSKIPKIPISKPDIIACQADLDYVVERHAQWIASILHPSKANQGGRANLSGCDLSGLIFDGVDLRGAKLAGCTISKAEIVGSNFSTCDFSDANLSHCIFDSVSFRRANLSRVVFDGCQLRKVDFRRANWEGSSWEQAVAEELVLDPGRKIKGLFPISQDASDLSEPTCS